MTLRPVLLLLIPLLAACGGQPTPEVVSFVPSATAGAIVPTRRPTSSPTVVPATATATDTATQAASATSTATATETPTATPTHTETPSATPTETPTETATATPSETPTATHTPTETATPTPATPVVQAQRDIPVRGGPGTGYPMLTMLAADEMIGVTGISEDGNWYQVQLPDNTLGWVTSASAQVSTFGNLRGVPIALEPTATPTDTPTATDTATHTPTPTATDTATHTLTPTATLVATDTAAPSATHTGTPTLTATATPVPTQDTTQPLPESIMTELRHAGVTPDNGTLAATIEQMVIDLTDEDNVIQWERFNGTYGDFIAGVNIAWGPGAAEDSCGFLFREVDENNFYTVRISRDGFLWFVAQINGVWQNSINGDGTLVRTGQNERNQLTVVASGDTYTVYLNGEYAARFSETSFDEGLVGLVAGTFDESDAANCTFTDGWVWSLTAPPPPGGGVTAFVQDGLRQAAVPAGDGFLAARLSRRVIDLSGVDNRLEWQDFPGETYTDFAVGTTFAWGAGAAEDYCGLVFRETDNDNFYTIQIDQTGGVTFNRKINGQWLDGISGQRATVSQGEGATNTLVLVARGQTFEVYVNGQMSGTFEDAQQAGGSVAVMAGTYDESDKTGCTFTNNWLWQLGTAPPAITRPVQAGETVQGTINNDAYAVRYTFDGQAGEAIGIRMNRVSGDLDPYLVLLGPDGARLADNDDDPQGFNRDAYLRGFELPVSGQYVIVATRFQEDIGPTSGDFTLTLEMGSALPASLNIGDSVDGTIGGGVSQRQYVFEARAGDVVTIRMERTGGDLDPLLVVLDPQGRELARNDDAPLPSDYNAALQNLRLPADGRYVIVATRFQEDAGLSEGTFRLRLERGE